MNNISTISLFGVDYNINDNTKISIVREPSSLSFFESHANFSSRKYYIGIHGKDGYVFAGNAALNTTTTTSNTYVATSVDGNYWSEHSALSAQHWTCGVYALDKYWLANNTSSASNHLYSSSDGGVTWDAVSMSPELNSINGMVYVNNRFIASVNGSGIYYSDNGISWVVGKSITSSSIYPVKEADGFAFLFGVNTTTVSYSIDGKNWSNISMPVSTNWCDVVYREDSNEFIFISSDGTCAYAPKLSTQYITTPAIKITNKANTSASIWSRRSCCDGKNIYTGSQQLTGSLCKSTDGGRTWSNVTDFSGEIGTIIYEGGNIIITSGNNFQYCRPFKYRFFQDEKDITELVQQAYIKSIHT